MRTFGMDTSTGSGPTRRLHAWASGRRVGTFCAGPEGVSFSYDAGAEAPVSLSMPLDGSWDPAAPRNFVAGLLPDLPEARARMARALGVGPGDELGLLDGLDCPGDLVLTSSDSAPAPSPGQGDEIDGAALAAEIDAAQGRSDPVGRPCCALAGAQPKFAVAIAGGRWLRPGATLASTHIVKPDSPSAPGSSYVEAATMDLAEACGLDVPWHAVVEGAGRHAYIVARFDRSARPGAPASRVPAEDLVQALGLHPDDKYGVGCRDVAGALLAADPTGELAYSWFDQLCFCAHVGDADAHAKNFGLLLGPGRTVRLSPLYDALATRAWDHLDASMAIPVNGRWLPGELSESDWAAEAERCGLDGARVADSARRIAGLVRELAPQAFSRVPPDLRAAALAGVEESCRSMLSPARRRTRPSPCR